jgi:hypothetical protein
MIRTAGKTVVGLAGGLIGLALVVLVAAVATNGRDAAPSADALRLAAVARRLRALWRKAVEGVLRSPIFQREACG